MARRILVTPRPLTRDGHPALQRLREAGCALIFSRAVTVAADNVLTEFPASLVMSNHSAGNPIGGEYGPEKTLSGERE